MTIMGDPFLSYFALGLLIFVFVVGMIIYEIMATHDGPYLMARFTMRLPTNDLAFTRPVFTPDP